MHYSAPQTTQNKLCCYQKLDAKKPKTAQSFDWFKNIR